MAGAGCFGVCIAGAGGMLVELLDNTLFLAVELDASFAVVEFDVAMGVFSNPRAGGKRLRILSV